MLLISKCQVMNKLIKLFFSDWRSTFIYRNEKITIMMMVMVIFDENIKQKNFY